MNILIAIWVSWWITFSIVFWNRNERTHKYMKFLLNKVSDRCYQEIKDGKEDKEWVWRFDELKALNYHEMVVKFWRSPESFVSEKLREDLGL